MTAFWQAMRDFASAGRDVLALLFTPVVTAICCWLICILAYGAWGAETQEQRINYLGALAIVSIVLVGFGGQWFQRNRLEKLKFTGPAGIGGEIEAESETLTKVTTETTVSTEQKP